jgi:hypothetical protein
MKAVQLGITLEEVKKLRREKIEDEPMANILFIMESVCDN